MHEVEVKLSAMHLEGTVLCVIEARLTRNF